MRTIRFPRVQRLAKAYLDAELPGQGLAGVPVSTKNPNDLPENWIRLRSQGGPQDLHQWRCMLDIFICGKDETVVEGNANLVHSMMLQVPGVGITVPEFDGPYPWVRLARHTSGPSLLDPEEELPEVEVYRVVTIWHVLPIPS